MPFTVVVLWLTGRASEFVKCWFLLIDCWSYVEPVCSVGGTDNKSGTSGLFSMGNRFYFYFICFKKHLINSQLTVEK
jgi:hypothetical protein